METNVIIGVATAIVAAVASLIVAVIGYRGGVERDKRAALANSELLDKQRQLEKELAANKAELDRQVRQEDREQSTRAKLDRVREPLLAATLDLGDRIDNIRNRGFLIYLSVGDASRRQIAVSSTLYRFARYWCIVESLYDSVALGRFNADDSTSSVASRLRAIGGIMTSDAYDGSKLMMWREEQRAIAERMRSDRANTEPIGFASFTEQYPDKFSRWFATFEKDLQSAATSERFRLVQKQLGELASELDHGAHFKDQWERVIRGAAG